MSETTTFQGFLESSFLESSSLNGPSLQQMAALAAYSRAAMLAQQETKFFTPTIYSQMASLVLSHRYPAVYFADRFYPLRESNNVTTTIDNVETVSDVEDTKEFDSSTGSEDTSNMLQASFQEVPAEITKPSSSSKSSSTNKSKSPSSSLTTVSTQKSKRERKQKLVKEDIPSNKEKKADDAGNNNEETENEDEDDGPPLLEKFDATPLTTKTDGKSLKKKKKSDSFVITSSDGFKHPRKEIKYDKSDDPQLLPNKCFTSEELSNQTQPLEEWFLSNLTNPFPTPKQFNTLQYASNLGHLDIRQWFQSRRRYFCKQNPKSRPWSKKSIPTKRLSSSSAEDNVEEKGLMDEVVAKKFKTIKLEVSELEFW